MIPELNLGDGRRRRWDRISWWYSLLLAIPLLLLMLNAVVSALDAGENTSPAAIASGAETPADTGSWLLIEDLLAESEPLPRLTARAALAVDLTSRRPLFVHGADTRIAPASTVKIVTALVAREILETDDGIVVEDRDLILDADYSMMGLELGDVATVDTLLHGTLLSSGGDAALVLARAAGLRLDPSSTDPVGRFVEEMNAYADRNGLHGSHFSNPVGGDADDQYTTAWDMMLATEKLLNDPLLAGIVATPTIAVRVGGPNPRELELTSTNELVLAGESFGIKTGTTESAGQCLINATWSGDHKVVTVIMGSTDRYADTRALLESIG